MVAGALLAFTLSIDEFVIAFFTRPHPDHVADQGLRDGAVRRDARVNALATLLLLVSIITVILVAVRLNGRAARRALEGTT